MIVLYTYTYICTTFLFHEEAESRGVLVDCEKRTVGFEGGDVVALSLREVCY